MMKKQFVSYTIALKLKELGFDEECLAYYRTTTTYEDKTLNKWKLKVGTPPLKLFTNGGGIILTAPLWQQAIDWFREKHNYHIDITFRESNTNKIEGINSVYFDIEIYHLRGGDAYKIYKYSEISDDYYYTRKEAILKAIELCQKMN